MKKNSFVLLRKLNKYVLYSLSLDLTIQNLHINKDVVIAFLQILKSYVKKLSLLSSTDSDLETFSHNPADRSFAALPFQVYLYMTMASLLEINVI